MKSTLRPGQSSAPGSGKDTRCCSGYALSWERIASDDAMGTGYASAVQLLLGQLQQIPGRPSAMSAFDRLFSEPWRLEEIERSGRPVIGSVCNFMPEELVLAVGAIPLRLDLGQADAAQAGGRVLPGDVCSAVKTIAGAHLGQLPYMAQANVLVIPAACDGKKKMARLLGDQREVWLLELPHTNEGARARSQWLDEIHTFVERLETLSHRSIRRGPLKEAIGLLNQRGALVRQIDDLRWQHPQLLSGRDMFLVLQASFIADAAWWVAQARALLTELQQRATTARSAGPEPPRILLAGSPVLFPDFNLLQTIEAAGAVVVADQMCSGSQRLYHPTVTDEWTVRGMIRAVAEKALLPCTCPCFVTSDSRIDQLLELVRRSRAQGVIHQTLRLCQLFDLELSRLTGALRKEGIPLLSLYTETGVDTPATVQNRVEAFLEMLQD